MGEVGKISAHAVLALRAGALMIQKKGEKMKVLRLTLPLIPLVFFLTLGCSTSADPPTPIPPTSTLEPTVTPEPEPEGIVVTFDGIECTVTGPNKLPVGDQPFVLIDQSDKDVIFWVSRLLDGKTLQDLIDMQSEPGEWSPKPDWVEYSRHTGGPFKNRHGEGEIWSYDLNQEGDFFLYVGEDTAEIKSIYYCAPLTVVAASTQ